MHYALFGHSMSSQLFRDLVIPGDHTDCKVTKIGNDYYATGSLFNAAPVIIHPSYLICWEAIAQALSTSWLNYGGR